MKPPGVSPVRGPEICVSRQNCASHLLRSRNLPTQPSFRYFLGDPSQPVPTVGAILSFVRASCSYLYGGSLITEPTLGCQVCRFSSPFYSDVESFPLTGSIGTPRNFRVPIHPRSVLPS